MLGRGVWAAILLGALGCGDDQSDPGRDSGPQIDRKYGRDAGRCGDGVLDQGEECDGSVLAQSCTSLGLEPGPLSCGDDCTLDRSLCGTRPPPPRSDSGFGVVDGALVDLDKFDACSQVLGCGDVPLPEDSFTLGQFGVKTVREYCQLNIDGLCMDCALNALHDGTDGGEGSCGTDCRSPCFGLVLPRVDNLLQPVACPAIASDIVEGYDGQCLCNSCVSSLHTCLLDGNCTDALLCVARTGCEGNACADAEVCRSEIRALSFSSTTDVLDELRGCIADHGCRVQ